MADFEETSHRIVTIEPGDVLVIGHAPQLSAEQAERFKRALGLHAVLTVPGPVDLGVVKGAGQNVAVDVTVSPGTADPVAVAREVRRSLRRTRGDQ
ncbi:hypothetical protein [Streptomyces griseus]|uniref:hypothetical protein n=1 Tax=Streptomyces griseus TaxID=1911 RepID=UPI0037924C11